MRILSAKARIILYCIEQREEPLEIVINRLKEVAVQYMPPHMIFLISVTILIAIDVMVIMTQE